MADEQGRTESGNKAGPCVRHNGKDDTIEIEGKDLGKEGNQQHRETAYPDEVAIFCPGPDEGEAYISQECKCHYEQNR